ncbi:OmpA family protein [Marinoscillum furvescens]|uniref:WD40 repeat protein n=1 Tax=Marinoscillum furvescens DSM 4134 TaxID=1122208 RepID=A0A3D9L4H4_MARFU|nr:OmpA family protein [Marinoscillum furvescens]REE00525.1 WD40 repeat protein [Marinoscillum furvescens DSM 4134]
MKPNQLNLITIWTIGLMLFSFWASAQIPDTLRTHSDTINFFRSTAQPIPELNSDKVEYAPSISADGRTMIFESNRQGKYELFDSRLVNGSWTEPRPIDAINNFGDSTDLIGGPSITFDGNTLFFFASFRGGHGSEDIYYSVRDGESWTEPKNIGEPINSAGYEGFPSISADGKTMYFVRQKFEPLRDKELAKAWENKACFSLYMTKKQPDGSWGIPELLPYPINQDCEKAPRIMADNRTLIFASNRLGGRGNFDLYQTQLTDIGDWKYPVALEYVNTPVADQFSSISAQGDLLYYVYDASEIYSVQIPPHLRQFKNIIIQGYITDGNTGDGIAAEIVVSDAFTSGELMTINNNPNDGRYTVVLAVGGNYNIEVKKNGYTSQSLFYDLSNENEYKEIDQDIQLYNAASLNLNIYDGDLFEPIQANIKVKEQGASDFLMDIENTADGRITLDLPLGKLYEIIVDKEHFDSEFFTLDVSGLVVYPEFIRDVEMLPHKRDLQINVADLVNNGKIRSRVRIRNRNRDEVIDVEGNETVALRVGDRYEIEATSDQGYAFNSTVIDVNPDETIISSGDGTTGGVSVSTGDAMPSLEMKLQPLLAGANLTLKDILFESNSDQLNEISYDELQRVIDLMKQNAGMKVEIAAHTDDVGSAAYNAALSNRRAQSVVKFLIENKIPEERFVARGYGESQPIVPNDSDENKAKNRRVVLKILEI